MHKTVCESDNILQTVILYGEKTHYFREVNELLRQGYEQKQHNDLLEKKLLVLTRQMRLKCSDNEFHEVRKRLNSLTHVAKADIGPENEFK